MSQNATERGSQVVGMFAGHQTRRSLIRRALALGLSTSAVGGLLAACGGDDNDDVSTAAVGAAAATPTSSGNDITTPTSSGNGTTTPTVGASQDSTTPDTGTSTTNPTATIVATGEQPKSGGTLRFGAVRDATVFDPHQSGGISHDWLLGSVYEKLVDYDPSGEIVGVLAEAWEVVDDTNYRFTLRQGVTFHSGKPFTSADVLATFERVKNPEIAAADAPTVQNISSIEAPDESTVTITLATMDISFLSVLAGNSLFIVAADQVDQMIDSPDKFNGTGPFIIGDWEPQRRYVLPKNPNYWRPGQPYIDELLIQPIVEEASRVDALRSGEVDLIEYVPWQSFQELEAAGMTLYRAYGLMNYVRVNPNAPPLDDVRVRQALHYIIDPEEVNALGWGGNGLTMLGPLQPPGTTFYFPELEGTYTKDWDKATALLAEAGYASPEDVPPFAFQVSVSAIAAQPGKVVHAQLQSYGLQVEYVSVDVPTLSKNRAEGTYVLHMDGGGMGWPDPDYLRFLFHSTDGTAYAVGVGYKNPELDTLLEEGSQTTDIERRKEIYLAAEKIILEDVPMIFLLWRPQCEAVRDNVKGYVTFPNGLQSYQVSRFEELWLDS